MSFKIPEEKIAEIREAVDIVDLISDYLTLKKKGKNYFGLCPFHQEKTPSFSVDPTKQMYHCFGCHKGGNVITFLMDYERLSFVEAVKLLAERSGIHLPQNSSDDALAKEKETLYFANKFAAEFFYHNLSTTQGQRALTYVQQRGYDPSIIRGFGLGYALPAWDSLIKHAQRHAVNLETLHRAGLIIKKDTGGYYDRFRDRVMIPIINLTKKVVGFGGRILTADKNSPKYLNSPETAVYSKSQILYGLNKTREHIKEEDQAIFVEGYTDLISLYQHGVKNVVATLGTALTTAQAQLIKRYTDNIVLLYDSDSAGFNAALRGADIFLNQGLEVRIAVLPDKFDPDSYIRQNSKENLRKLIAASLSLIKYKVERLTKQHDFSNTTERAKAVQLMMETVSKIPDQIKKSMIVKDIAETFMIEERLLLQELNLVKAEPSYSKEKPTPINQISKNRYDLAEENLTKLIIEDDLLVKYVAGNVALEEIKNPMIKKIITLIFNFHKQGKTITESDISNYITEPQQANFLSQLLATPFDEEIDKTKLLNDCIVLIKTRQLAEGLKSTKMEMRKYQSQGLDTHRLLEQTEQLRKELAQLIRRNFVTQEKNT